MGITHGVFSVIDTDESASVVSPILENVDELHGRGLLAGGTTPRVDLSLDTIRGHCKLGKYLSESLIVFCVDKDQQNGQDNPTLHRDRS